MPDLLVRGGRLIDPGSGVDAPLDLLLRDGRVARLGPDLQADAPEINAAGLIVAPGFVDLHTHLREPGQEHKETVASGARAAARGGFTTLCAMPNTNPPADTPAVIAQVAAAARGAPARVLPIGAVTKGRAGEQLAELATLRDAGAVAFSDDGDAVADAGVARRALDYLADLQRPLAEHCEDPRLAGGGVMHEGAVATRLGLRGQPALAETAIVQRDLALVAETGARWHGCHLSTAASLEAVANAKARGLPVSAEVTPHHLLLTAASVAGSAQAPGGLAYDTNAKVNPPLRDEQDVDACIDALASGVLDAVATDHAPHALPDKQCEFDAAAFGISALETAFGALGTLVARGRLDLATVIERLTVGPVRAWQLDRVQPSGEDLRGLGTLAEGAPADLVLLDPAATWTVNPDAFASLGKNTPLAGSELTGRVIATVYAGATVFNHALQEEPQRA